MNAFNKQTSCLLAAEQHLQLSLNNIQQQEYSNNFIQRSCHYTTSAGATAHTARTSKINFGKDQRTLK